MKIFLIVSVILIALIIYAPFTYFKIKDLIFIHQQEKLKKNIDLEKFFNR